MIQALFAESIQMLAAVSPISSAAVVQTGWIDVKNYIKIAAIVQTGLIAATGTFNAKLEQANTAAGGGAKDIPGKAIVQVPDTSDNFTFVIDCDTSELDVNNGFRWVRLTTTPAVAASLLSGVLLGWQARFLPVPQAGWNQAIN